MRRLAMQQLGRRPAAMAGQHTLHLGARRMLVPAQTYSPLLRGASAGGLPAFWTGAQRGMSDAKKPARKLPPPPPPPEDGLTRYPSLNSPQGVLRGLVRKKLFLESDQLTKLCSCSIAQDVARSCLPLHQ